MIAHVQAGDKGTRGALPRKTLRQSVPDPPHKSRWHGAWESKRGKMARMRVSTACGALLRYGFWNKDSLGAYRSLGFDMKAVPWMQHIFRS